MCASKSLPIFLLIVLGGCEHRPRHSPAAPTSTSADEVHGAADAAAGGGFDPASIAVLRKAAESSDYGTRMIAIEAVSAVGSDAFLGWLEHALGDPEHDIRLAAVDGLSRLGTPRARRVLLTVRDDNTEALDIRALAASAVLTPQARSFR